MAAERCGLGSLLPPSCRGRAEAFARRLQSRLRSLGRGADDEAAGSSNCVPGSEDYEELLANETWKPQSSSSVMQEKQPIVSPDTSDRFFDFDMDESSPGSPTTEELGVNSHDGLPECCETQESCDGHCCDGLSGTVQVSHDRESGCVSSPTTNDLDSDSSDGQYFDTAWNEAFNESFGANVVPPTSREDSEQSSDTLSASQNSLIPPLDTDVSYNELQNTDANSTSSSENVNVKSDALMNGLDMCQPVTSQSDVEVRKCVEQICSEIISQAEREVQKIRSEKSTSKKLTLETTSCDDELRTNDELELNSTSILRSKPTFPQDEFRLKSTCRAFPQDELSLKHKHEGPKSLDHDLRLQCASSYDSEDSKPSVCEELSLKSSSKHDDPSLKSLDNELQCDETKPTCDDDELILKTTSHSFSQDEHEDPKSLENELQCDYDETDDSKPYEDNELSLKSSSKHEDSRFKSLDNDLQCDDSPACDDDELRLNEEPDELLSIESYDDSPVVVISRAESLDVAASLVNDDVASSVKSKEEVNTLFECLSIRTDQASDSSHSQASTPDDERPRRVQRSSSLKSGKTPPGTPGRKKMVRFADVLGLDLADVRTFMDDIPKVPSSAYFDLHVSRKPDVPVAPSKCLVPMFQQPGGSPEFLDRVRANKVCLENAFQSDSLSISGTVRVLNIDFHKSVYIRYTLDTWENFADLQASYVPNSSDGFSDKFSFVLYAHTLDVGQRVEFAIRFAAGGQQFWDSNSGVNYCFQCLASTVSTVQSGFTGRDEASPEDDGWASFY